MHRHVRPLLFAAAAVALAAGAAAAQEVERVSARRVQEVMPEADRFDSADGDPPVKRAYRGDELIGYVFMTSDLPPEQDGYSGPIDVLVGVTTEGILSGVQPIAYRESRRYEWGDFLSEPPFLEQFAGKRAGDDFNVRRDIDGISGVTISVRAMARGIRDAARRVVIAYGEPPEDTSRALTEDELVGLSWYEMQRRGIAATRTLRQTGRNPIEITIIHLSSEQLGRYLMGRRYDAFAEDVEEAGGADHLLVYAARGGGFVPPLREGWSIEQGGGALAVPEEKVVRLGSSGGALSYESSQVGALLLDDDDLDVASPFTVVFDRGRPDLGEIRLDYASRSALALTRVAEAGAEPVPDAGAAETPAAAPDEGSEAAPSGLTDERAEASAPTVVPDASANAARTAESTVPSAPDSAVVASAPAVTSSSSASQAPGGADLYGEADPDGEALGPDWPHLAWTLLVIALACGAFFSKKPILRWISLAATMLVLGWIDGGFLSISHVTGLVWVGFTAIRSDPALVILTGFTLVTVLLWGRVFCGYLCPFGALQDFIDRAVPRRFKRALPPPAHRVAWRAKYLILALIVGAAVAGVETSLYQYFEPFGTVFFLSPSVVLWVIAGAILVASTVVPRFYCRYACPLGALLALGSLVSLRRIHRVEQCDYCHVCEQRCPTGAITGPDIDFGECVRCNVCEVQLIERTGVCRHDMEEIRPRLVQLRHSRSGV